MPTFLGGSAAATPSAREFVLTLDGALGTVAPHVSFAMALKVGRQVTVQGILYCVADRAADVGQVPLLLLPDELAPADVHSGNFNGGVSSGAHVCWMSSVFEGTYPRDNLTTLLFPWWEAPGGDYPPGIYDNNLGATALNFTLLEGEERVESSFSFAYIARDAS